MDMPKVNQCDVEKCAYNHDRHCRAMAITVGDVGEDRPRCDTYMPSDRKGGEAHSDAGVGACKVAGCTHNEEFECHAGQIRVGPARDEADCLTYEPR